MGNWEFPREGCLEKANKMYYHTMTRRDIEERLKVNDIIIVPVGSTENHGNAGPVGEDTFIVTRIAELVAARAGCTIASPLWYGSHPFHHIGQPCTVPLPDDVFASMIRAIISGYWNTGYRKQIFISMHGQEYIIPSAIQEWGKKYQLPAFLLFVDLPRVMGQTLMDREHGGPFETPFQHADEAETSISLALFPEFCDMEHAEDTSVKGYLPPGHVDRGGDIYGYPIPGHCQVGNVGIECITAPQGVLGKATRAEPQKAKACIERACDYLLRLHDDILRVFPPGRLPDARLITQRDQKEVEAFLKGPTGGGKHIYTIAWPS